jgi:hypothetical protein
VIALDTRRGRYRRLLRRDDRLVGTILLGDLRDARALREHLTGRQRLPEALLNPMPLSRWRRLDRGRPPQRRHRSATNAMVGIATPRHRVAGNMIARLPSGGASAFTAMRGTTIADPCWCSSPPLRPTLRTAMPAGTRWRSSSRRFSAPVA